MEQLICISESVYREALTRGNKYAVIALDDEKRQVCLRGDNGRSRWFPLTCFSQPEHPVPTLVKITLDDPIDLHKELPIEVTVQLSNGERRWCIFATPAALTRSGDWIEGSQIPFHFGNRHVILAAELNEELIDLVLRYVDSRGHLVSCTRQVDS